MLLLSSQARREKSLPLKAHDSHPPTSHLQKEEDDEDEGV
jgi:hypothetical protein